MESLANVLERHKGELVDVVTHAGQKLSGLVQEAYEDFFTMSSVRRVFVIPYTGISTLQWPAEQRLRYREKPTIPVDEGLRASGRRRRKPPEQKHGKRTPR